jgi:hypothetical protein
MLDGFTRLLFWGILEACGPPMNGQLEASLRNPWLASTVSFGAIAAFFIRAFVIMPCPLPTVKDFYSNQSVSHASDLISTSASAIVQHPFSAAEFGLGQSHPGVKWRFYDSGGAACSSRFFHSSSSTTATIRFAAAKIGGIRFARLTSIAAAGSIISETQNVRQRRR